MKCYCGSPKTFAACCEKFLNEEELPATSEELMRSRYSAFCTKSLDYLRDTLDPQNRHEFNHDATARWAGQSQFNGLEIIRSEDKGTKGIVEFKAHYSFEGQDFVHHEISTFRKHSGQWFYKTGKILEVPETNPPA